MGKPNDSGSKYAESCQSLEKNTIVERLRKVTMSSSSSTEQTKVLPHIVDGKTFSLASEVHPFSPNPSSTKLRGYQALGATAESCHRSVESAAAAFPKWKATHPSERQRLFLNLAKVSNARNSVLGQKRSSSY